MQFILGAVVFASGVVVGATLVIKGAKNEGKIFPSTSTN